MKTYQVDASMMGQTWSGTRENLERFCEILGEVAGATIVPVLDSCNGARNEDPHAISERDFARALDEHSEECPEAWSGDIGAPMQPLESLGGVVRVLAESLMVGWKRFGMEPETPEEALAWLDAVRKEQGRHEALSFTSAKVAEDTMTFKEALERCAAEGVDVRTIDAKGNPETSTKGDDE